MPLAVAFSTAGGYGTQPADANGAPWVDPNAGVTPGGIAYVPGATPAYAAFPSVLLTGQPFAFAGDLALTAVNTVADIWGIDVQRIYGNQVTTLCFQ